MHRAIIIRAGLQVRRSDSVSVRRKDSNSRFSGTSSVLIGRRLNRMSQRGTAETLQQRGSTLIFDRRRRHPGEDKSVGRRAGVNRPRRRSLPQLEGVITGPNPVIRSAA
jgi:hypothetical protein